MGTEDDDEFWNESCKCLMKTILYYVMEKEEKKDLLTCFLLMSLEKDKLFEKLDKLSENSKLAKYYSILKTYPEKTYSSVVSTAIMKLAFVINAIPEDRNYEEKFDFTNLRNNKIAIFLICEENCKEDKKIINIFISQLLSQLKMSDSIKERIYFILDDVNIFGKIYELPRNIEIARARKISFGADSVELEAQKRKVYLIILAQDSSERTKEKFQKISEKYNIPIIITQTIENLSKAIGKNNKAILGIGDINLAKEIQKINNGGEAIG